MVQTRAWLLPGLHVIVIPLGTLLLGGGCSARQPALLASQNSDSGRQLFAFLSSPTHNHELQGSHALSSPRGPKALSHQRHTANIREHTNRIPSLGHLQDLRHHPRINQRIWQLHQY